MKCQIKLFAGGAVLLKCLFNEFSFSVFLLLHWWLLFYRAFEESAVLIAFSENATTFGGAGYWFIPGALIRKTGSQTQSVSFTLFKWALHLHCDGPASYFRAEEEDKNEIFRSNWPRQWLHYETGRQRLKASCFDQEPGSARRAQSGARVRDSAHVFDWALARGAALLEM